MMVGGGKSWRMPQVRGTPTLFVDGSSTQDVVADATTEVGDLMLVLAFGTSGTIPAEGAVDFTDLDSIADARKGLAAYRIATDPGAHTLGTFSQSLAVGLLTFKKGTFNPVTPFDAGGLTDELFTNEPDSHVAYPALSAPVARKSLMICCAYSNLVASYGALSDSTTAWNRTATSNYTRCFYRYQPGAFAGENVNHVSGTPAQTCGFITYLRGYKK
jgi:hypothetical protein